MPAQVIIFKVDFYKAFLKTSITETKTSFSFDEIWKMRTTCITNLSDLIYSDKNRTSFLKFDTKHRKN